MIRRFLLASLVSLCTLPLFADDPAQVQMTAQQDHKLMMDKLGIKEIRRGRDGMNKNSERYANYDESKANPFPKLPDPLLTNDGKPVTTADMWWKVRRPELVELFDREIYGRVPKETPKVTWEVTSKTDEKVGDVPVVVKKLVGHVDNSSYKAITVDIQLTLTTPKEAKGPVPVMMEFGFMFGGARPGAPNPAARPAVTPAWQKDVLAKGWGFAILSPYSIQADTGGQVNMNRYQGLNSGIIGLCNKGQSRKPDDWGALRAWAWGASRVLDYFESDKDVDAKKVAIEGHSRFGKAALVTLAYEPRMSNAYVSSSGQGGAKLHRRDWGEIVENVAGSGEYHWMAGNYIKYAGPKNWNDLPIDSHELIALCAPRPVFISAGKLEAGDGWVDAKGMFMAAAAAGPVYKLLGKKDLGTNEFPPIDTALVDGEVAFKQHTGGHVTNLTWPTFITFAERYWK